VLSQQSHAVAADFWFWGLLGTPGRKMIKSP